MNDEEQGLVGCFVGLLEAIGFFVAITWPILLLMYWVMENRP